MAFREHRGRTRHAVPLYAYHGRYLCVDVGTGTADWIALDPQILRQYVGGVGLGTWLLWQHGGASQEPLAPEAPLVLAFGPLVGSPVTTSAKMSVTSRSPLTGLLNDALLGGGLAMEGKACGGDAIVIRGRAAELSCLVIDDGHVRLDVAHHLRGVSCPEATVRLQREYGAAYRIGVIGPAGENGVRFATFSHGGRHAGRGGTGAVLGSKNLKAILVRGTQPSRWADEARLAAVAQQWSVRARGPTTAKYRELGTAANLTVLNRLGALPIRNFQQGSWDEAERLAPESLAVGRSHRRTSCVACTIGCEHGYTIRDQHGASNGPVRAEYENLFACGPLCGVSDPDAVLTAIRTCDALGMDTISAGGTLALAMECVERGWLEIPWLRFGASEGQLRALELIARRDGVGQWLAEGSRRLAECVGRGAEQLACHVKGLELPGYDPRAMQTLALGLAVGTRGADHNRSGAAAVDFSPAADRRCLTPAAARLAVHTEDQASLLDSLILCRFLRQTLGDTFAAAANMLTLATGWPISPGELQQAARRIATLKKWFNIQAGWTPAQDWLPDRFFDQALPEDATARLSRQQLQAAIGAYNHERGWTGEGWIEPELLARLGISGRW